MPDTRSALASSAARCARAASHSSCEVAICRASSLTRSARSNCVPSFSWKVIALQLVAHDLELLLEVLLPEELGVGEPCGDDLLVAGDDGLAAVLGLQVGDQQEVVRQLLAVPQREALLMRLHRRRQALGRHVEERLVEFAHEHRRPLGEAGVLGGERVILDERQVRVLGQRVRAFVDARRARRGIEDRPCAASTPSRIRQSP